MSSQPGFEEHKTMNSESDYEDPNELIREMTNFAYSCLYHIECVFNSLKRVSRRFPINEGYSRFGWVLRGELTKCFAHCVTHIKKLEEIYEPYWSDRSRLNFAIELVTEANAEWLHPISFKGYESLIALEAVDDMANRFYSSDFLQIASWAEERVESETELEDIRSFLEEFSEINDEFVKMLHFKLEQQLRVAEKSLRSEQPTTGTNTANSSKIKLPENPDVLDLCKMLKKLYPMITQAEVARQFIGNAKHLNADSLLQQARRYRHLWHPDHI
ncbi:hypothetical protein Pan241w_43880 [Gimesia alba]|uniref:Uncharacterized protein n=1 Tax=Gimesia alba TaxID=2527973 RepID=A0A517RK75_9PLAN|nr:hypothetical protein [Gimesia alba]QDT44280.1 hypothetical protein Pan241w_43880 [Gimesia alba]